MKIYCPETRSLIEYFSSSEKELDSINKNDSSEVKNHLQYFNKDIAEIANLDDNDVVIRLRDGVTGAATKNDDSKNDAEE